MAVGVVSVGVVPVELSTVVLVTYEQIMKTKLFQWEQNQIVEGIITGRICGLEGRLLSYLPVERRSTFPQDRRTRS